MAVKSKKGAAPASSSNRNVKAKPTNAVVTRTAPSAMHSSAGPESPQQNRSSPSSTPYQRLRELLVASDTSTDTGDTRVISTVEGIQEHLQHPELQSEKVALELMLLWISDHTYKEIKFVRLHFIDAASPEPLPDLLALFRDKYEENRDAINSLMLTATMWNMESHAEGLPPPGAIVSIKAYSSMKLFRETVCQATIKLRDLSWRKEP